jgi:hypothetical protein
MIRCIVDWRNELVDTTVEELARGVRLTFIHDGDQITIWLSLASIDALTWACLRVPRAPREGGPDA